MQMNKNALYWIMLSELLGPGSYRINEIIDYFDTPYNIFSSTPAELAGSGVFSGRKIEELQMHNDKKAKRIIQQCAASGYAVLTPDDSEYPARLREIKGYPAVLYVWGELPRIDDELTIAMVGARDASAYGLMAAGQMSGALTRAGALVISGGALGIDTQAHKSAIEAGGKTVAVLACGFNAPYLSENAPLRQSIARSGAVISELPPDGKVTKAAFPIRNRIISGLSLGTLVVEASERSGSLITASHAASQGRDVFAIPGGILSQSYKGTNKLLRDGAKPVFSAVDVIEGYLSRYKDKIDAESMSDDILERAREIELKAADKALMEREKLEKPTRIRPGSNQLEWGEIEKKKKNQLPENICGNSRKIYDIINFEPLNLDQLANKTALDAGQLLGALTELEMLGYIESMPGGRYVAKGS